MAEDRRIGVYPLKPPRRLEEAILENMRSLQEAFPISPLIQDLIDPFYLAYTWWQIGVIVTGVLFALWVGGLLQNRLQPAIQPGAATGYRRMAMRTGALATIPLILWLWLLTGSAILRH